MNGCIERSIEHTDDSTDTDRCSLCGKHGREQSNLELRDCRACESMAVKLKVWETLAALSRERGAGCWELGRSCGILQAYQHACMGLTRAKSMEHAVCDRHSCLELNLVVHAACVTSQSTVHIHLPTPLPGCSLGAAQGVGSAVAIPIAMCLPPQAPAPAASASLAAPEASPASAPVPAPGWAGVKEGVWWPQPQ